MTDVRVRVRPEVDDVALSALHAAGFDETPRLRRWSAQLAAHSLSWLDARDGDALAGFVNLAWDGDRHAFLLDLVDRLDGGTPESEEWLARRRGA